MGESISIYGLTPDEQSVMDKILDAYNAFCKLDRQHPNEGRDFTDGIHKLQSIMALRIARRVYPKGWPIKIGGDHIGT